MQDVFEPTANFGGDVFEPMANFGGDVFEPMNFAGEVEAIAKGAGDIAKGAGDIASARARKEESKSDERKYVDTACGKQKNIGTKKQKSANLLCRQNALNDYLKLKDKDRLERSESMNIEKDKISLQKSALDSSKNSIDEAKNKKKKNLILGLSIGGGVLILGAILIFAFKRK